MAAMAAASIPGCIISLAAIPRFTGAALFRLRERDFGEVVHQEGISPAWPVGYDVFEPFYTEAEKLFAVHGQRGEDPLEPWASEPYPYPPVSHEPKIQALSEQFRANGLHPYHLPLGIKLDERDGKPTPTSICIRCDAFDGFPCLLNGKADAQVMCVDPTLAKYPNVELLTNALVTKLETDASGRTVTGVHVTRGGAEEIYAADIVVVACGALSSALLLLRSANDAHPNGLANGSGQVGRNYMRHNQSVLMALMKEPNHTIFQKTLAVSDFYFGADDWEYPLGLIQMCATSHAEQIKGEALPSWLEWLPDMPFDKMALHSMDFWLSSEDLPRPENRIYYDGGRVMLDVTEQGKEAHQRLKKKLEQHMTKAGVASHPGRAKPLSWQGASLSAAPRIRPEQRGFGTDPATSVLNLDCRAYEVDNLYVTDASFFPSIGAVNPTLTIIANALRVAAHIQERLGA